MKEITEQEYEQHIQSDGRKSDSPHYRTVLRDPTVIYHRGDFSACMGWRFDAYQRNKTTERWVRSDHWHQFMSNHRASQKTSRNKISAQNQRYLRPSIGFISEVKRYLAMGMTTAAIADLTKKPESEVIAARNVFNRDFSQPQPK